MDPAEHNRRRVGWIDLPGLRKALAGSRGAVLHMNKLDVLSGLEQIKVCTHYRVDGQRVDVLPDDPWQYAWAEAVYERVDGWPEEITAVRDLHDLPAAARRYARLVEAALPCPIVSLGVGPANDDFLEWVDC